MKRNKFYGLDTCLKTLTIIDGRRSVQTQMFLPSDVQQNFLKYFIQLTLQASIEQYVFRLLLIKGGATEKVSQFIMLLKSIYIKDFCFNKQKCFFDHGTKVKTIINLHNYISVSKEMFCVPFQNCPLLAYIFIT